MYFSFSYYFPNPIPSFEAIMSLTAPFSAYGRFATSCGLKPPVDVSCLSFAFKLSILSNRRA